MLGKILCFLGWHYWINTDDQGLAGEHRCKYCNKLGWEAIQWPTCPPKPKAPNKQIKPT